MIKTPFIAGCVAALVVASAIPDAQQGPSRPNVLLVTLDTFRADRIGAYGYKLASTPHLDRLARRASGSPMRQPSRL